MTRYFKTSYFQSLVKLITSDVKNETDYRSTLNCKRRKLVHAHYLITFNIPNGKDREAFGVYNFRSLYHL